MLWHMLIIVYQNYTMCALNDANLLNWNVLSAVKTIWCASANVFWKWPAVLKVSFQPYFISAKRYGVQKIFISISDCPCQINCLDGCDDCPNTVCQCEVSIVFPARYNCFLFYNGSRTWNQTQIGTCVLIIMEWPWEDVFMHVMEMKLVNLTAWLGSKLDKWTVLVKLVSFSNNKCAVIETTHILY